MPTFTFQTKIPLPETAADLHVRLQSLFAIKDELDKEIESLIGRRTEERKPYHCVRCDHKWYSRLMHRPQKCPVCRTNKFDTPPAFTYEEKLARKKERMAKNEEYLSKSEEYLAKKWAIPQPEDPGPLPHSVLTRSIPEEPITLAPPPVLEKPLSLRERLEQMKHQAPTEQPAPVPEPEPVIIATDEELVEAINNGDMEAT